MNGRGNTGRRASEHTNKAFGAGRIFDERREKLPALHRYSVLIFALLFFAYLVSGSTAMEVSLFDLSGNIVYRGQTGVALVCPVRWDAKSLDDIMQAAEQAEASIAFFVTADWAEQNSAPLSRMRKHHEVYLLGSATTRGELETERQRFEALGLRATFYMPERDADAHVIADYAEDMGMRVVLASIDVLSRSSNSKDAAERIANDAFDGAIIRFEPTAIVERALPDGLAGLRDTGLAIHTLPTLCGDHLV